jgi:geranylgeranyl diphosphate synthase type I
VFGDPSETGKPSGDDLREGKPTLLLALASEYAAARDRPLIDRVGSPDLTEGEVAELRSLFETCGARAMVEAEIERLVTQSERALALWAIAPEARAQLRALATCAIARAR